jgi:hypothetical protein
MIRTWERVFIPAAQRKKMPVVSLLGTWRGLALLCACVGACVLNFACPCKPTGDKDSQAKLLKTMAYDYDGPFEVRSRV